MMKLQTSNSFFKQKQTWIILAAALLLIIVASVWWASSVRHGDIMSKVDKEYTQMKSTARILLPDSSVSRDKRIAAVEELSRSGNGVGCEGEWWNGWYGQLIPVAAEEKQRCNKQLRQMQVVSKSAMRLNEYLQDDAAVAKTLAILKVAAGAKEWQKVARSSVDSVLMDIEAITPSADTKALLSVTKEKVLAISKLWNELFKASEKEDKSAYMSTKDKLIESYAALGAVGDASDAQVDKLVTALQREIRKL